jgi:hypothetical protein
MLQGVSYVQNSAVYIRNLIPEEWDLTLFGVLGLSGRGYADLHAGVNFAFWAFSEVRSPLGSVTFAVTLRRRCCCRVVS